ncbi:cAMP-binding proteins [Rubrobacter xylanophilus DSM 9941]|uniref:cAMP-binding proteins n=1 Tax=Rubrobacter xylanophilus (strain DSM 9941 / JCM 11954 / NBRC 16129 / PRD-1) TaxID=266117 RepID=Q1AWR1_RUBXD|nr:Crp/Fnr family transcriptional regulator [Rubrobacter xylanophilus]ABG04167.1 cAMP-binding proteins [Rubrobacter xylanophilus DSM 9941]
MSREVFPGWYFGLPEGLRREACLRLLEGAGALLGGSPAVLRYAGGEALPPVERGWACVLVEGFVRVRTGYRGYAGLRQATLALAGPWQLVWGGRGDPPPAEALTGCAVARFPEAALGGSGSAGAFLDLLEDLLAAYEGAAWALLPRGTRARLSRVLALLAGRFGRELPGGAVLVPLSPRRADLAEMAATTRESMTRAVAELVERGTLEVGGRGILIEDAAELAALAGD